MTAIPASRGLERPSLSTIADLAPAALALAMVVIAILARPLLPVDETRYLTVAWEMFRSGDHLVPTLNGELYSHKPPMLFWLINAAWAVTGPNAFAGRLVPALFMPVCVFLVGVLGRRVGDESLGRSAGFVLVGMIPFTLLGSMAMFDAMLASAVLAALIGLADAAKGRPWRGFLLVGLATGAGLLIKGPAVLLHVLPAALFAPLWAPRPQDWRRWYALTLGSVVLAAAVALAWVLPAAQAGGPVFGKMLLWGQTAGRVASAEADHAEPFWLYFALLPVLTAPWCLSPTLWKAMVRSAHAAPPKIEPLHRLPLIASAASFILFTLLSAKQPHYLLPAMPSFALMVAILLQRTADPRRTIRIWSALGVAVFLAGHAATALGAVKSQDPSWIGRQLRAHPGAPVAFVGRYNGELGFIGRLSRPVDLIGPQEAKPWMDAHPGGVLIGRLHRVQPIGVGAPVEGHPYRGGGLGVWIAT